MKFYIRKLGANELGYRKGKQTVGQFFFISKKCNGTFFPKLSKKINNDHTKINIFDINRKFTSALNLHYHNDKHNKVNGSRDEFRIYLNRSFAPNNFWFKPNDILLFEKKENSNYHMTHIRETSTEYNKINEKINKNHYLTNDDFHSIIKHNNPLEIIEKIIYNDPKIWIETKKLYRKNQDLFRKNLLKLYDYKCAISNYKVKEALEAAHIDAFANDGNNSVDNGIILRSDLHDLFDSGLLKINPQNYTIEISNKIKDSDYYKLYHGKKINQTKDGSYPQNSYLQIKYNSVTD